MITVETGEQREPPPKKKEKGVEKKDKPPIKPNNMNTRSAFDSGIFRAVVDYGKKIGVCLPPPTSPTADRVASQLFPERTTVPTREGIDLYHDSLEKDMNLYLDLLEPVHRPEVEKIINSVLEYNRAWFRSL